MVSGLKGDLALAGREYRFDVTVNYGRSEFIDHAEAMDRQRFVNAVNVAAVNGIPTCSLVPTVTGFASGVAPVADAACVPLNLFGEGAPSRAALDYVVAETRAVSRLEQFVMTANLAGSPFALFGNAVAVNLGVERREEHARFIPDAFLETGQGRSVAIPRVAGSFTNSAIYGELAVPLILPENDALISKAILFARVRHVGSNRNGGFTAWSAGGSFSPVRDVELRGNYTRSFRSPAVLEMFLPRTTTSVAVPDLCSPANIGLGPAPDVRRANCQALLARYPGATPLIAATASVPAITGGNPGLDSEAASSFTFGATLRPRFIPGLVVNLDWLDIEIRDPIANLAVSEIASACFDNANFDASDPARGNRFCALIGRDANGQVLSDSRAPAVTTGYVNGHRISFSAVQASLSYSSDLEQIGVAGGLELGVDVFHLRRRVVDVTGVAPARSDGLVGDPRWEGKLRLCYANSRWGMTGQINFTGKQLLQRVDKFSAPADRGEFHHFEAFATFDASLFLTVSDRSKFSLTITNAFNRIGQEYYGIIVPTSINDALGRRFAASLTLTL